MPREKTLIHSGLIVGIIVVIVLLLLTPAVQYNAHGVVLPAKGASGLPAQSHVALYQHFPTHYQTVGTLHAERHIVTNDQAEVQQFVQYVKSLAAKAGANGVVIDRFGKVFPGGAESQLKHYVFYGTAILTKDH